MICDWVKLRYQPADPPIFTTTQAHEGEIDQKKHQDGEARGKIMLGRTIVTVKLYQVVPKKSLALIVFDLQELAVSQVFAGPPDRRSGDSVSVIFPAWEPEHPKLHSYIWVNWLDARIYLFSGSSL